MTTVTDLNASAPLSFADADVPAVVRATSTPNPFLDVVKELAADTDDKGTSKKAKSFTIAGKNNTDSVEKGGNGDLIRAVRRLQDAGKAQTPPVTVRIRREETSDGTGKSKTYATSLTFWTTKKITRKDSDQPAAPAAAAPQA